jgi:outer membrane immunogenic protein
MKKFLIAAALAVFSTTGANAADMAARPYTKAPPVAPSYNWTGFYAGVNVGGGWSSTDASYTANDAFGLNILIPAGINFPANGDRFKASGILGGLQAGYNYQFDRRWVAGLEADFQGADISGSTATQYLGALENTTASNSIKYFGTFRGRLGYLPTDRLLTYVTGGLAYAQLNNATSLNTANGGNVGGSSGGFSANCGLGAPTTNVCYAGSSSSLTAGWTVGGGLEYAFAPNWSLKAEYLYANFRQSLTAVAPTPAAGNAPSTYGARFITDLNIARVGLNYQFGR